MFGPKISGAVAANMDVSWFCGRKNIHLRCELDARLPVPPSSEDVAVLVEVIQSAGTRSLGG